MKSLFWLAAAQYQVGNGYAALLAMKELEKAFNGVCSLITVPMQPFPESPGREFIVGDFEIEDIKWRFWFWGLMQGRAEYAHQLVAYDYKTDFRGVICLVLNPPVIPLDSHNESFRPILLDEQRKYVAEVFDFFVWRGLPFKLPIFLLQIHDTTEPESLNVLQGDELSAKLPADLFYRTCSISKLENIPELIRRFIQFLAEGENPD